MTQEVTSSKAVEIHKGGHVYAFIKITRAHGGAFYMASRDNGKMRIFNSKRDMAKRYTSIASEIRSMKI